jgi:nucleoside-diphosphate-sugar epimerase
MMNILVVGGTGMVGGDAAIRLKSMGHNVEIASRKPAAETTPMATMPFHAIDYVNDTPDKELLSRFDVVVFAAGNDVRHIPRDGNAHDHWDRVNSKAVPAFAALAKAAGVKIFILIGSFYPQAAPQLIERNAYVASRLAADEGVRALADDSFRAITLNAPYIIGHVEGLVQPGAQAFVLWATGRLPQIPRFTIPGGVNVISTTTLTDAIVGAIERGQNGKAYLIGDQNMTYQDYFGGYFRAAGDTEPLEVRDEEHPFASHDSVLAGRGSSIYYEPDPAEVSELGYRRNDVARTFAQIVAAYR